MASDARFVEHVCEQAGLPGALNARKMFGEYALYLDGRVVGLVCSSQLYLKPTAHGKSLLGAVAEHPPYPGARPCYRLDSEIDDPVLLKRLLTATALALPLPKPRAVKRKLKAP